MTIDPRRTRSKVPLTWLFTAILGGVLLLTFVAVMLHMISWDTALKIAIGALAARLVVGIIDIVRR